MKAEKITPGVISAQNLRNLLSQHVLRANLPKMTPGVIFSAAAAWWAGKCDSGAGGAGADGRNAEDYRYPQEHSADHQHSEAHLRVGE